MSRQQMYQDVTVGDGIPLSQIMTPVQDPDYDTNSLKRSRFPAFISSIVDKQALLILWAFREPKANVHRQRLLLPQVPPLSGRAGGNGPQAQL